MHGSVSTVRAEPGGRRGEETGKKVVVELGRETPVAEFEGEEGDMPGVGDV